MKNGILKLKEMIQQQIDVHEGNKLIREYLGNEVHDRLCYEEFGAVDYSAFKGAYDNDWRWLMPAIIKISCHEYERREDQLPFGGTETVIETAFPITFGMRSNNNDEFMFRFNRHQLFKATELIQCAYEAVVDFIKWYNEENKQP